MAAPFIIPFNNQPLTTTIKTASYTIPAGKYAKATGYFISNGSGTAATYTMSSLSIDGVAVLRESGFRVTRTIAGATAVFTVPSTFCGTMTFSCGTSGVTTSTLNIDGIPYLVLSNAATAANLLACDIAGGAAITYSTALTCNCSLQFTNNGPKQITAWVPAGTVLTGSLASSFHWIVEEYNVIS